MKKLDKFILKSYLGPFVLTFFISLFILLMQFVWKYVDELIGKGLEWTIIVKLLIIVSATMVTMALPLAILLSSLMAFGGLGEYMELTAIKASGVSLQRAMRPVLFFCFFMALVAFYFSNNILPVANLKMRSLLHDIRDKRPELNIKPGIFNSDLKDFVIRIGKKSRDGHILEDVMIYDHSNHSGNDRLIVAEKAFIEKSNDLRYLEFRLINGHSYTEANLDHQKRGSYPFLRENFSENTIRFDRLMFALPQTDEKLFKKNYQMLNLSQLERVSDTLRQEYLKEKTQIVRLIFNSPFFLENHKYSTVISTDKTKNIPDSSADIQKQKDVALISADTLTNRDSTLAIDSEDTSDLKREGMTKARESLIFPEKINRGNVLVNFRSIGKRQVAEATLNKLRNKKSLLDFSIKNLKDQEERINRHEIEWHRKFTLSAACILLFLIGAPLGAIVRKGGLGMPVVISLIFFIVYYMLSITGEKLAREGVLSPFNGMWLSAYILLPMGIFITWKATHDSPLFNMERYLRILSKTRALIFRSGQHKD